MITKEQLDAVIKAVNEGGDDDDEITEDEVIAILRDGIFGIPLWSSLDESTPVTSVKLKIGPRSSC